MSTEKEINRELIAHDFQSAAHGAMSEQQIEQVAHGLTTSSGRYPAKGNIVSLVFYQEIHVYVDGGKNFDGKAGGLSSPGSGALFGDLYTDDINRLYRDTVSFEYQSTPVYFSVLFFDGNSNLLGHFQAGAVSIVTGIGGGSGSWS